MKNCDGLDAALVPPWRDGPFPSAATVSDVSRPIKAFQVFDCCPYAMPALWDIPGQDQYHW